VIELPGLSANANSIYQIASQKLGLTSARIADVLSVDISQVNEGLNELQAVGIEAKNGVIVSVPSLVEVLELIAERQMVRQSLEQDRLIECLTQLELARAKRYDSRHPETEVVQGASAINVRLEEIFGNTNTELVTFAPGGNHSIEEVENAQRNGLILHSRSVRTRTIFLLSSRLDRNTLKHVEWLSEHGSEVRAVAALPVRMIISDQKLAVLPSNILDAMDSIVIHTNLLLVKGLYELFEYKWDAASPFGPLPKEGQTGLSEPELTVLKLLSEGRSDDYIARRLGVVSRTIRRRVDSAMEKLGVTSRLAAIYKATKSGLI
jgi:DNA-binding CsgD family transcriptional regulator